MDFFIKTDFFNPELTLIGGQAFRWKRIEDNRYFGIAGNRMLEINCRADGFWLINITDKDLPFWLEYFNTATDYRQMIECFSSEPVLNKACEYAYGLRQLKQEPFETLISFICSQRNSIPNIKGMIERLCTSFGEILDKNCFAFPTAYRLSGLSEDDLASVRVGYRAKYIIDAARKVKSGEIDLNALYETPIDEARNELMKIKGVGEKVADCVLLCAYGKVSAFPKDVWIKRAMERFYPNGLPPCTAGFEGLANQYLFEYIRKIK
ncbi:MAG: DNA-3-methyladenine glycosylase 2 [Oscillospiraceae bacterium]|nr:DNA-3-methyladenine glycosylase 2 [Oscillospiraceae bacterium]